MKLLLFLFTFLLFPIFNAYSLAGLDGLALNTDEFKINAEVLKDPLEFYLGSPAKIPLNSEQAESRIIQSISFEGNNRTSNDVIFDNIALTVETPFTKVLFDETLKNLKNMQVFSKIKITIHENREKKLDIKIVFVEKWTMIPYIIAGSGGGSSYYALGLYDTNFIGRLYTFNFTYGCKNFNCSSVAFFRNPSLFGSKINYVINPALYHNVYTVYNKQRVAIGAFSNQQNYLLSYADFPITPGLSLGAGVVYQKNLISSDGLSGSETQNNIGNNFTLPNSTSSTAFEGRFTLGQINYDGIVIDGVNFVSVVDSTFQAYSVEQNNYTATNNTVLFYQPLPLLRDSYFAFRGNVSITSSTVISQYYYLGGLDKIRGFYDGEFSGKFSWFSNAELRIPSYVGDTIALQHVLFSDAGYASNSFSGIFVSDTPVSVGAGLRILFLDINKIALRVDCAYTLNPFRTYGISLGLLQFF